MKLLILKFLAFSAGCVSCHLLQTLGGASPVMSSAGVGVAATLVPSSKEIDRTGIQHTVYAGAFAGMSSPLLFRHPRELLLLSLIGTIVYLSTRTLAKGFGGKLGTVAFIACALFSLLRGIW